jgi:hypothetical protein
MPVTELGPRSSNSFLYTYFPLCPSEVRPTNALLHGCCTKAPDKLRGSHSRDLFYLQNSTFSGWACLDSNQGPLPYQGESLMIAGCRLVREFL